jgi:16S rRNA (guanine966-N2)-methyltransferase
MRILAGEAKGRVLRTPAGKSTRPTDSRARETLFNILGERILDARVLDLYAGSGALGLEALSRGAAYCVFVEQNAAAANAIRANLSTCRWTSRALVWQATLKSALHHAEEKPEHFGAFEIIFADPPFDESREFDDLARRVDILARLLHNVGELSAGSSRLVVVQHPRRMPFVLGEPFQVWKTRRTGDSCLSFFEIKNDFIENETEHQED